jgi:hypothetical protein
MMNALFDVSYSKACSELQGMFSRNPSVGWLVAKFGAITMNQSI